MLYSGLTENMRTLLDRAAGFYADTERTHLPLGNANRLLGMAMAYESSALFASDFYEALKWRYMAMQELRSAYCSYTVYRHVSTMTDTDSHAWFIGPHVLEMVNVSDLYYERWQ